MSSTDFAPRKGSHLDRAAAVRLTERADVIKTLDPAIFIDFCEVCGDFEDACIRWVDTKKDGENSFTKVVGKKCINYRDCGTGCITEDERFVGCCYKCASNML